MVLQVDELSNRIGNYFASQGIKHGDSVAVFLENRVEYVCLWLGLTKVRKELLLFFVPSLAFVSLLSSQVHTIHFPILCMSLVVGV